MVTRSSPQGEVLCQYIQDHGGSSIFFPTLNITPVEPMQMDVKQLDWLIFTSPQAVYHSVNRLLAIPRSVHIAAIGAGTAQALQEANIAVSVYPKHDWNSEGLLALPSFQQVEDKKIAIIKGKGGRTLLAETLIARGCDLTQWVVYERTLPKTNITEYVDLLQQKAIDVIICTSIEGMQNLKILLKQSWSMLQNVPILVISERMKTRARELGFNKILTAQNANHNVIIERLAKGIKYDEST
ncbi:MAG TPA: uroporphyrinogen-III synthase [Candidatus Babeliaceae bacterium]|nr:uroporphyrinogen-III synthase [Candidatus Babeliaceae bacterium]